MKPPSIKRELWEFSQDPKIKHEQMVDMFGFYFLWLRSAAHERVQHLIESPEARQRLAAAFRAPYERVATTLTCEQAKTAMQLADAAVDQFAKSVLSMLSAVGSSHRLGSAHSIQFKLDVEVRDLDANQLIMQETINRGGQKHFADYWGKWLLDHSQNAHQSKGDV